MSNHPTARKFDLKTYRSKFAQVRCAISGKYDIKVGDTIVNLVPVLALLQTLGVVRTKVFKYAKVSRLPLPINGEDKALLVEEAEQLLATTDPEWPKDNIGCSASSYWPLQNWRLSGWHELGTQQAARALWQHVGTQIGADSKAAEVIEKIKNKQWSEKKTAEPADSSKDGRCLVTWEKDVTAVNVHIKNGKALIAVNPWKNQKHEAVKNELKRNGAKWNGQRKVWEIVPAQAFEVIDNLDEDLEVRLTPDAMTARNTATPVEKNEEPEVTAELNGRKVTVRSRRKSGEVLVSKNGHGLKVEFDYVAEGALAQLRDMVKSLGGKWDKPNKCWWLGTDSVFRNMGQLFDNIEKLVVGQEVFAEFDKVNIRRQLASSMDLDDTELKDKINKAIPKGKKLYPFQAAGVAFLEQAGGRALIGDEMGLGKSIETAAFLAYRPDLRPAVLVVPAIVTTNWVKELKAWTTGEKIFRIKTGKSKIPTDASIIITTYSLVKPHLDTFQKMGVKAVISDESHYLKSPTTFRTKAFKTLAQIQSVKSVIALSGTPIVNRPKEFFTILNLLRPEEFGSYFRFTQAYCDGHYEEIFIKGGHGQTKKVWIANGVSNSDDLANRLRDVMVRRKKEDVLTELPAKIRIKQDIELNRKDTKMYKDALASHNDALTQITAARHALGVVKVPYALEWIKEYQDLDQSVLVFAHHRDVLDDICYGLEKEGITYGRIDGSTSHIARGKLVDNFQAGRCDVMVLSAKAAGVGITLTRASDTLFVERLWTPGDEEQCEDRTHRIGQNSAVTVRYLVAKGTLDEWMDELIESKREVLHAVLDQGKLLSDEDLDIRKALCARLKEAC